MIVDLDQLLISGEKVSGDLRDALVGDGVTVELTINGASTLNMTLLDPDRRFLNSDVFNQETAVELGDVRFMLAKADTNEQDDVVELEWEDALVRALRRRTGTLTAAAGTTTRGEFAARLAEEAGVPIEYEPGDTIRDQIGRGITDPEETSWEALNRLATDVGRRCLSTGTTLLFGSDAWLRSRTPTLALREHTGPIGRVAISVDVGAPADSASFTVVDERWTVPIAHPVDLVDMGPGSGEWLTAGVVASYFDAQTRVRLTRQQQPLPEPEHEAVTPNGADGTVFTVPAGGTSITPDFVKVALSQAGKSYVFGAEALPSNSSPRAFDCSELVEWSLARVGITFIDGSYNQQQACARAGRGITVDDAVRTYGALLFRTPGAPGHVAISLGNGQTIEARGRAYGVGQFSATSGRSWTHGGLIPGVTYR